MTYQAKTTIHVVLFPFTKSTTFDVYPDMLIGTGIGNTPSIAYKNSINNCANIYQATFRVFVENKQYQDIQVESTIQSIITKQPSTPFSPPVLPQTDLLSINTSIKNTVSVRNSDNSTEENTSSAFIPSNGVFQSYFNAFNSANVDQYSNAVFLAASSHVTSTIQY